MWFLEPSQPWSSVICEPSQGEAPGLVSNTDRKIEEVKKGKVTVAHGGVKNSKKRWNLRRTEAVWRSAGEGAPPQVAILEDILGSDCHSNFGAR